MVIPRETLKGSIRRTAMLSLRGTLVSPLRETLMAPFGKFAVQASVPIQAVLGSFFVHVIHCKVTL